MARATPRVQDGILEQSTAESMPRTIVVNSLAWYEWLEHGHGFYFEHPASNFTARKSHHYWYAYKRKQGKLNGVYIGKEKNITLERLNEVAYKLAQARQVGEKQTHMKHLSDLEDIADLSSGHYPLIVTKLYPPSLQRRHVPRARLIQQLNESITYKLTLLLAPAGFGKTTVLSEWIHSSSFAVAWLSIDKRDNESIHFFRYVVAALKGATSELTDRTLTLLHAVPPPPFEMIMTTLINEIASISRPCVLILDNFHLIHTKDIHQGLAFLLHHLPPHFHLIIATREEPPFPLTRLRAAGEMFELQRENLCFTSEETTLFLTQTAGLDLSTENVRALEERAGGWIMGLQLMALSLQRKQRAYEHMNMPEYLRTELPSEHYLLDYLANEVLADLPYKIQQFLLKTSLLTQFTGELCDTLIGSTDGHGLLAQCEKRGLFIAPLAQHQNWFRYHPLFADVLAAHLQRTRANIIPLLHLRAAHWYAAHDMVSEAMEHTLAARNDDHITDLSEHEKNLAETRQTDKALATKGARNNQTAPVSALNSLCKRKILQGQLYQAANISTQALQLATTPHGVQPFAGKTYILLGTIFYEWNKLDEALHMLNTGITLCKQWKQREELAEGYLLLVYVKQARGDVAAALEICQETARTLDISRDACCNETSNNHRILASLAEQFSLVQAWLKILQGEMTAATRWLQERGDRPRGEIIHAPCSWIAVITAWLDQGYTNRALQWLETRLQTAASRAWTGNTIEILTLKAICLQAQGKIDAAIGTLAHALALAEPAGYIRTFLDKGTLMVSLLHHAYTRNIMPDYTGKLLALTTNAKQCPGVKPYPHTQALSPRELEVLRCIAQGLSNQEIAQKLVLASGTIKKHIENIYSKLDVKSRTQAVIHAQKAHLVNSSENWPV